MSLPDTAEYWEDVKRKRPSNNFYHAKDYPCGHRHNHETDYIGDVDCHACKRMLDAGDPQPWMKQGEAPQYYYMTKAAASRHRKADAFRELHGTCPCGNHWVRRKNASTGGEFLGCSDYPKCKNTKNL